MYIQSSFCWKLSFQQLIVIVRAKHSGSFCGILLLLFLHIHFSIDAIAPIAPNYFNLDSNEVRPLCHTLDNGFKYVFIPNNKPRGQIEFQLLVNAGKRCESADQTGLSHLLGHILFKSLEESLQRKIFQSRTTMWFDEYFEVGLDITSYRFIYKPSSEIDKFMVLDMFKELIKERPITHDLFSNERQLFLPEFTNLLSRFVADEIALGRLENLPAYDGDLNAHYYSNFWSLSLDDLSNFKSAYYTAENMTLVITGDIEEDIVALTSSIEELFSGVKIGDAAGAYTSLEKNFEFKSQTVCLQSQKGLNGISFYLPVKFEDAFSREDQIANHLIFSNWINFIFATNTDIISGNWSYANVSFHVIDNNTGLVAIDIYAISTTILDVEDVVRIKQSAVNALYDPEIKEVFLNDFLSKQQKLSMYQFRPTSTQLSDWYVNSLISQTIFRTGFVRYRYFEQQVLNVDLDYYSTLLESMFDLESSIVVLNLNKDNSRLDCSVVAGQLSKALDGK